MKALIASLVILSSSIGFAQAATTPAQPELTEQQVVSIYFAGCAIEKYCAAGTQTAFDTDLLGFKADVEKSVAGTSCEGVFDLANNEAAAKAEAASVGASIASSGQASCLSSVVAPVAATPAPAPAEAPTVTVAP